MSIHANTPFEEKKNHFCIYKYKEMHAIEWDQQLITFRTVDNIYTNEMHACTRKEWAIYIYYSFSF